MTVSMLEAIQIAVEAVKTWVETKFLSKTSIDDQLNSYSSNPVQNKVVNAAIEAHANNQRNPHNTTAEQTGAVPISRTINGKSLNSDIVISYSDLSGLPNDIATEDYVNEQVAGVVDSAPTTLNTLNKLAEAIGDNPNFASTVSEQIQNLDNKVGNLDVSEQINEALESVTADDFGIYVQDTEPMQAVVGDIWIDTSSDPTFMTLTIPPVTAADNGKVLMVVDGEYQLVSLDFSVSDDGTLSV